MLINELAEGGKLPNLCTIVNGVDPTKKKYGYSKYDSDYGYGYGQDISK